MSIEAGGAFSGKLESIDGLKLNNRAEIHINKYYQGIITLYRVSRKIVNMAQEKIEYLVIKLENEEKITAIGLNFKSASGGVNNCFKLELQADILLKGKMAYANTSKFQEIDYIWNIFGISYYGNKKVMKQFEKISKDLYIYYGVSEDDIKKKTERYLSLVTALSS